VLELQESLLADMYSQYRNTAGGRRPDYRRYTVSITLSDQEKPSPQTFNPISSTFRSKPLLGPEALGAAEREMQLLFLVFLCFLAEFSSFLVIFSELEILFF